VCERRRVGEVIHRHDIDVVMRHCGAHDVAADASEAVDPYFDSHDPRVLPKRSF
jgi:hypothetical protein